MKQIVVLSGKGGTGKSSFTSAVASLAKNAVFVDADVDAANLYLIMQPENYKEKSFLGGAVASIDYEKCVNCGACDEVCRFDAISFVDDKYLISPFSCDGCDFCRRVCPSEAISLTQSDDSKWFIANTRFGPFVHAKLGIGEDNSGKLVSIVRNQAKLLAVNENKDFIIIDGPPGIGCPVMSSLSGVDTAVLVTEASISGLHDLKRVAEVVIKQDIRAIVVINKFDINLDITENIRNYCEEKNILVAGEIPYDNIFTKAMIEQKNVIEYDEKSEISVTIKDIWEKISE